MLNSGSSEAVDYTLAQWPSRSLDEAAERLPSASHAGGEEDTLSAVSRDFASVFYTILFREMQKTINESDESDESDESEGGDAIQAGTQDFLGTYMPMAMAGQESDPLSRQIHDYLQTSYGPPTDESA